MTNYLRFLLFYDCFIFLFYFVLFRFILFYFVSQFDIIKCTIINYSNFFNYKGHAGVWRKLECILNVILSRDLFPWLAYKFFMLCKGASRNILIISSLGKIIFKSSYIYINPWYHQPNLTIWELINQNFFVFVY